MKIGLFAPLKSALALLALFAAVQLSSAQSTTNCAEISNDVSVAVSKDPSKVLMVVEDALVINEGCAGEIVKAAIVASKADSATANQIVETAISVAPKMAAVITDTATSLVPGLATAAPAPSDKDVVPVVASEKNPGKNPIVAEAPVEEDFFVPSTIRGVYLIQPPASGPLPCDDNNRCNCNPVSPSNLKP